MSSLEQVQQQQAVVVSRDRARAIFGQTMGLVALTCAVAALGAYLGRDIAHGWGIVVWIGALVCLFGLNAAVKRSEQLAIGLLFGVGAFLGVAAAPALSYYASVEPRALWQAAGTTALFIAGFGVYGYATRRDLSMIGRIAFFALLGLIVFGIVLMFVSIPAGHLIYAVLGLVIFAGYTMYDFQRLRRTQQIEAAPLARGFDLPRRVQRLPAPPVAVRRRRPQLGDSVNAKRRHHPAVAVACQRAPEHVAARPEPRLELPTAAGCTTPMR